MCIRDRGRSTVSGGVTTPRSGMSFASGGTVTPRSGQRISGMGPDTQLIAAQPGEVVMSKKAVDYHGKDNLLAMNAAGGGTNKPTTGSAVMGYQGGGAVRRNSRGRIIRRPATVAPSSPQVSTPSPPRGNNVTVVPITKPKQSQQPLNSGSSADQKTVALFSPIDFNNNERMGVRAEYQLV